MKLSEIIIGLIKIPLDFLMGMLAFVIAFHLRSNPDFIPGIQLPPDPGTFPSIANYLSFSSVIVLVLILLLAANRSYSLKRIVPLGQEIGRLFVIIAAWIMLVIAYFFIIREFPFSRLALGYGWLLTTIFIIGDRIILTLLDRLLLKYNIGKRNILFIGNNVVTGKLSANLIRNPRYSIIGFLDNQEPEKKTGIFYLGNLNLLDETVKKHRIHEIIQTRADLESKEASDILDYCRENHIEYSFVPDLVSIHHINIDIRTINGIPVIKLKPTPIDGWGRVIKRVFDLLGSSIGLLILSPIFLITAIAVKLDSRGTIFFKYLDDGSKVKRVGQYGKLFDFYKFRTMFPNTHNLRYTKLAENNIRKGTPLVKIKNDPRITRVGRVLRKTNIDELPQLINVLKGEMSLVGPRPHLPEEVAKYKNHHKFVLTIKPGITGLAQISGRSDLDFEEEIQLDTYYIEHWSIWLDLKIIFKTIGVFFQTYEE